MSSRARVYAVVGLACAAAAAVAVTVAWSGRGESAEQAAAQSPVRPGSPPIVLDVAADDAAQVDELERATKLYEDGNRPAALQAFAELAADDPDSLYAAVGEAMARWPNGTIARLAELEQANPESGLVRLHRGLALYWIGQEDAATAAWREAESVDPDSPAAVRAETLLHPEMPEGRPFFVSSTTIPADLADLPAAEQLAELERRAEAGEDSTAWLLYGVGLQRTGRPVSAESAFARAAELAPDDPQALVAAAVGRFDKDDPSRAFSRLGPLAERFPDAGVVRFHLGLLLLWLSDVEGSRAQLQAAVSAEPDSIYGREAAQLLERLDQAAG